MAEDILRTLQDLLTFSEQKGENDEDWIQVANGLRYAKGALKNIQQKEKNNQEVVPDETEPGLESPGAPNPAVVSEAVEAPGFSDGASVHPSKKS